MGSVRRSCEARPASRSIATATHRNTDGLGTGNRFVKRDQYIKGSASHRCLARKKRPGIILHVSCGRSRTNFLLGTANNWNLARHQDPFRDNIYVSLGWTETDSAAKSAATMNRPPAETLTLTVVEITTVCVQRPVAPGIYVSPGRGVYAPPRCRPTEVGWPSKLRVTETAIRCETQRTAYRRTRRGKAERR